MKTNLKKNPFKVPDTYFEQFTDGFMQKLDQENTLIPKKEGFKVPDNYFDNVPIAIQEKLNQSETKVIQLPSFKKVYAAIATIAAILIVFMGIKYTTQEKDIFTDLATSDIETYFETNDIELSTYEIAEVLAIDELEINEIIENEFIEENVLDYLNENVNDIEDLNLESYE